MEMTRRRVLGTAGGFAGMSTLAMLSPHRAFASPFHWANCSSGDSTKPFRMMGTTTKVAVFDDWREGDCEMQGASVTLASNGTGTFRSQVCTHFTHSKDVWHFGVELLGNSPTASTYYQLFQWDGPKMSEEDHPLYHPWSANFRFDPSSFSLVQYARATSCC